MLNFDENTDIKSEAGPGSNRHENESKKLFINHSGYRISKTEQSSTIQSAMGNIFYFIIFKAK